jgi:hypothetical protein
VSGNNRLTSIGAYGIGFIPFPAYFLRLYLEKLARKGSNVNYKKRLTLFKGEPFIVFP